VPKRVVSYTLFPDMYVALTWSVANQVCSLEIY